MHTDISAGRIGVLDDDPEVLHALATLLEVSGFAVTTFRRAAELLAAQAARPMACLLVDLHLAEQMDGVAVLEALRARGDATPVIMVTAHGDVAMAVRAMRAGAADFVEKPYTRERLMDAVRDAQAQGAFLWRAVSRIGRLTPRERQVLDGLVEGKSNKAVAADLGISARTVEIYRATLMEKMEAQSIADVVRMVMAARGAV